MDSRVLVSMGVSVESRLRQVFLSAIKLKHFNACL